ncbi:MAG TPA: hypothetical protein PLV50_04815 [Smithella sp.]|nr:hypothetical protein [Smithella sp.]MDM7987461.1 hypothetical protein [Smithella sp.]HNY50207.1 hypothetical protein [Smithella sp.]HOG89835.1 hypothetical protein [Smithella sp.]HOU50462.1 hypothetical protein [Smithella sp.]
MEEANKGVIDLADRVLKELLKKPGFKEGVRTVLQNIDPESSRRLVRTMLWQDPEFFLGVLGAVPSIVNSLIQGVDEVLIQINEKFSPQLLHDFMKPLVLSIDKKTLESIVQNGKVLANQLWIVAEETYNEQQASNSNTEGNDHGK